MRKNDPSKRTFQKRSFFMEKMKKVVDKMRKVRYYNLAH